MLLEAPRVMRCLPGRPKCLPLIRRKWFPFSPVRTRGYAKIPMWYSIPHVKNANPAVRLIGKFPWTRQKLNPELRAVR